MPNQKLDKFFANQKDALTFDDVRLETGYADFLPAETIVASKISRNVSVMIPIISAAMDTVTESPMAIAIAKFGGIGSIHRALSPEAQAKEVARVKHHHHGLISEPITVRDDQTVESVIKYRKEKRFEFDSLPVVNADGRLVGLMTHQDFKRCDNPSVLVGVTMTPFEELITASRDITKRDAYELLKERKKNVLPLVDANRRICGMYVFSDLKRILAERSNHNVDSDGRLRVAAAVGVGEDAMERAALLCEENVDVFHIDTGHGYCKAVIDTIKALKEVYPYIDVIAGNISRGDAAIALAEAGADGILVGQGGGSICTTRRIAGIGKPQVSAVYECAKAIEGLDIPICSDGGIRESGDIVIAFGARASTVMAGSIFAGTTEAPGEEFPYKGGYVKVYRGMGSLSAQLQSASARQRYSQTSNVIVPEGVEGIVQYRGPVNAVLEQYVGGIRKGMHYVGARTINEIWDKAELFTVTEAGVTESHPHDLLNFEEAPNYTRRDT